MNEEELNNEQEDLNTDLARDSLADEYIAEYEEQGDPIYAQPEPEPQPELTPPEPEEPEKQPSTPEMLRPVAEAVAAIPISAIDFGMDVVGMVPGLGHLDDAYDDATKFKNPYIQKFREVSSIILPSMLGTGLVVNSLRGASRLAQMPKLMKALTGIGAVAAVDAGVTYVSDTTEEGDNLLRGLDDLTGGALNIPDNLMTLDSDSTEVRRYKNTVEAVGLSIFGDILGYGINFGKALKSGKVKEFMDWFKPSDDAAKAFKASKQREAPDIRPGEPPIEATVRNNTSHRDWQKDDSVITRASIDEMEGKPPSAAYDPMSQQKIASESTNATLSVEPAAAVKNAVDIHTLQRGASGDAVTVATESQYKFISRGVKAARTVPQAAAKAVEEAGVFQYTANGLKGFSKDLDDAALEFYVPAMSAKTKEELDATFLSKRNRMYIYGDNFVEYATEDQTRGAMMAMRTLTDTYLGKPVAASSARLLKTNANEITSIANGAVKFEEIADPKRVRTMILDRMQYLMQEVALNKYISGWQLANKKLSKRLQELKPGDDTDEIVQRVLQEFDENAALQVQKSKKLRDEIEVVFESDPEMARPLIDAFAMSKGDINTIDSMMRWAESQISKRSLLVSPKEGMSMFAQGLWAVRYNNVLSGLSALRAGVGNTTNLLFKSATAMTGHGLEGLFTRDFSKFRRATYAHGAMLETNRRALSHAWDAWKRTNDDPRAFMDLMRKDRLVARDDAQWDLMQQIADNKWAPNGDTGKLTMWNWTKMNRDIAESSWMRWGTNAMIAADQYANVSLAHVKARMMAYEEVSQKAGFKLSRDKELIAAAEKKHYDKMFDKNGLITDDAVKHSAGELALNLDDAASDAINSITSRVPALKSLFMFPRTGINALRLGLTYTPIAAIPGSGRMAKILTANTPEKITEALVEHGIKSNDPARELIYQNLKAEYKGRIAMGSLMIASLMGYAMSGNVRGNGPVNGRERQQMKDTYNWTPKTIKIGGKWVSYAGVEPFDTILSLVGDLALYSTDIGSSLTEDAMSKISWTLAAGFTNKTFMSGLEPLVKLSTGDETAMARLLANEARAMVPMSGALGVFANALSSSQKDIHKDMIGYVRNRLPLTNEYLPERIDFWTNKPINDIDNPYLRALNAFNPVPISEGKEPWREWMMRTGWTGTSLLRKDSTGLYEYSPDERVQIYKEMGKMQLWRQVEKLMESKAINDELRDLREYRAKNPNVSFVELKTRYTLTHQMLDGIVRDAQKMAEAKILARNPGMLEKIRYAQAVKGYMKQGKVKKAAQIAEEFQLDLDALK